MPIGIGHRPGLGGAVVQIERAHVVRGDLLELARRTREKPLFDLLQLRGELLLRDGLTLLPVAVLVPDRPLPAPLSLGGYTVIPWSSLRARLARPRAGCGDSVGILKIAAGACVIFTSSLPAFPQAGRTDAASLGWSR